MLSWKIAEESPMHVMKTLLRAGVVLAALSLASPLMAQTTHTVTVGDNFFSPANLTIQAGDTVRWVNAGGGNPHNVTQNNDPKARIAGQR